MKRLIQYGCRYWAIATITLLMSCSTQPMTPHLSASTAPQASLPRVTLDETKIVTGQTVYVPVYSYIYHHNSRDQVINLTTTLSIRNTDLTNSIILTTVRYYDTNGQLVKPYLDNPVVLNSMASTDILIEANDIRGGIGANFIVEWVAEHTVYDPVIEAVMISTTSTQGISFVSPGRVLKHYTPQPE